MNYFTPAIFPPPENFVDICKNIVLDKSPKKLDLNTLKCHLKTKTVNLGVFKHWTRKFIQCDNLKVFKIMCEYELVNNALLIDFASSVLQYDSVKCFTWLHHKYNLPFLRTSYNLTKYPCPKIATKIVAEKMFTKHETIELFNQVFAKQLFPTMDNFFIECFKSNVGIECDYKGMLKFVSNNLYRVVKYLFDNDMIPQPTKEELNMAYNRMYSYNMYKLLCDHSEELWELQSRFRKGCIDRERILKDDYNEILFCPLHKYRLPIYLTFDLLKLAYPENYWLQYNSIKVLKLIELIRNKF